MIHFIEIFGSCNGLLLIRINNDLFLWNLLTRCSKKVLGHKHMQYYHCRVLRGLCFDSSNNEYKALLKLTHESGHEFFQVGSFRSKTWTEVHFPYRVYDVKSGPVVNENLHWFGSKSSSNYLLSTHQIIAFNPQNDEFKKVPMPQPKEGGDIVLGLGALDGCLCMTRFFHPRNFGGKVEVLAMKEYGVKSSWTLMFSLSNLIGFDPRDQFVPLCTTKNQEVIMKMCSRSIMNRLRAYNPIDNSYRDIPLPAKYYSIEAVIYDQNLVTPPAYDWEEEELRRGSNICGNFSFGLYSKIETDKERMEILESLRI